MNEEDKTKIDLQRFRRDKIKQGTMIKMILFLFILVFLLGLLYFLFKKIQAASNLPDRPPVEQEHRIQIDTTGFRN